MSLGKTIAKNTIFLYFRMLFNMGISLYTSRVILETLGVEDFGIYSLVAGVVVLFSFLNNSMNAATQRFISYEKASSNAIQINKIFNVSVINHGLISLIFLFFAETIGLWFLNMKLNIPQDRMYAANIAYQMSVLTAIMNILRVPYNATIIAYERMRFFAFLGIFETVAKLLIVYLLVFLSTLDSLILYSILLVLVSGLSNVIYLLYCKSQFKTETIFRFYRDFNKTKELFAFSSWIVFGQVAVVGASQGLNMLINIFYGVTVNAALGIANQVNGILYSFISNFQVAFQPQLVQTYANKQYDKNKELILNTSKYSFFLMVLLSLPILCYPNTILTLWLGSHVPPYTDKFVQVIIFCSLIDALAGPFWTSAMAIGSVKEYNVTLTVINLLTLPLAYGLLRLGYSPVYAYYGKLLIHVFLQIFRFYFIHRKLNFESRVFLHYLCRILCLVLFLVSVIYGPNYSKEISLVNTVKGTFVLELSFICFIWFLGLNRNERYYVFLFFQKRKLLKQG